MSSRIVYDSLLVHYLARELHERLSERRLRAVRFHSEARRLVLELDDERLVWELHPTRGWIRLIRGDDPAATDAAEGWAGRRIRTQRRPRVRRVHAPLDERVLAVEIDAGGSGRAARFVVELMTNQWNVLALDSGGTVTAALWSRESGDRTLRAGAPYAPPAGGSPRAGVEEPVSEPTFRAALEGADGPGAAGALVRTLAWTSPLNASAILHGAGPDHPVGDADGLDGAYHRYRTLASRPPPSPRLLPIGVGQPYPLPLPGHDGRTRVSLLAAFEDVARAGAPSGVAPEVRAALEDRLERVTRRARALRREAGSAPSQAADLRGRADLLMARLHQVERGVDRVELEDFEGGRRTLELDPALSPAENADALYDRAKKRERAAERLPARVRETLAEQNRLESLLEALDEGDVDPDELARWIDEVRPDPTGDGGDGGQRLPYRTYRSSGGLEIRVGRSGRANDDLTFHHSAPDDIWLHARNAAGAHVILRWTGEHSPPQRDLIEAAVLAALNSRARTSGAVPVDWTRRKYVRSPRKAPPGAVIPDRVSTVFVEPDPDVERRLRD